MQIFFPTHPPSNHTTNFQFWSASSANVTDMGIINFNVYSKNDPTRTRLGYLYTDESLTIGPGFNVIHATGMYERMQLFESLPLAILAPSLSPALPPSPSLSHLCHTPKDPGSKHVVVVLYACDDFLFATLVAVDVCTYSSNPHLILLSPSFSLLPSR